MKSKETQTSAIRLSREHIFGVSDIERLCFDNPWTESGLELLIGKNGVGAVVLCKDLPVSYGGMMISFDEGAITNIATHPNHRRKGFAGDVLRWLIDYSKKNNISKLSLEVRESNAAAISLYESFGFYVVGKRPNFYRKPIETALVMILEL